MNVLIQSPFFFPALLPCCGGRTRRSSNYQKRPKSKLVKGPLSWQCGSMSSDHLCELLWWRATLSADIFHFLLQQLLLVLLFVFALSLDTTLLLRSPFCLPSWCSLLLVFFFFLGEVCFAWVANECRSLMSKVVVGYRNKNLHIHNMGIACELPKALLRQAIALRFIRMPVDVVSDPDSSDGFDEFYPLVRPLLLMFSLFP